MVPKFWSCPVWYSALAWATVYALVDALPVRLPSVAPAPYLLMVLKFWSCIAQYSGLASPVSARVASWRRQNQCLPGHENIQMICPGEVLGVGLNGG